MNSRLAGTTMCKISFEGVVALKRAGVVSTSWKVYSARLQEKSMLFVERRNQTSSFQSHHSFKRVFTHGCTRKFTILICIYSYSYSSHHAKLQTPVNLRKVHQPADKISDCNLPRSLSRRPTSDLTPVSWDLNSLCLCSNSLLSWVNLTPSLYLTVWEGARLCLLWLNNDSIKDPE